jgi:hypothetical protein
MTSKSMKIQLVMRGLLLWREDRRCEPHKLPLVADVLASAQLKDGANTRATRSNGCSITLPKPVPQEQHNSLTEVRSP